MVVVQTLIESMSRCFGSQCPNEVNQRTSQLTDSNEAADKNNVCDDSPATTATTATTSPPGSSGGTPPTSGGVSGDVRSRDLKGLEWQNHEFDEVDIADVIAKARKAAHPKHRRTSVHDNLNIVSAASTTRTRQRAEKRKADIFRMRPGDENYNPSRHGKCNARNNKQHTKPNNGGPAPGNSGLFSSKFLSENKAFANVLCFATPVRDTSVEEERASKNNSKHSSTVDPLSSNDNEDDTNTLNTCEDTITSTLYYDSKFQHVVEERPPMPLFRHFEVPCDKEHQNDELKRIVSSGSHRSFNLWHVIQPEQRDAMQGATEGNAGIFTGDAASPKKSSFVQHLQKDRSPSTPASVNKKQSRSIEATTPVMIVDPQVKHHPKQQDSTRNSFSKKNQSTLTRHARSQSEQSPQHNMRITISSSDSEDDSQRRDLKKNDSTFSSRTPSSHRRSKSTPSGMKSVNAKSSTPDTSHTTVSTSSSSSSASSARRSPSSNKSETVATKLETRLRHRNQLNVISIPPNSKDTAKMEESFPHENVPIVTPTFNTKQPHYTMGNDSDALPNLLKLKNSSLSTAPTTPSCSMSRSVSLERGGGRSHASGTEGLSSSTQESGDGVSTVTHDVIA